MRGCGSERCEEIRRRKVWKVGKVGKVGGFDMMRKIWDRELALNSRVEGENNEGGSEYNVEA